MKHTKTLPYTFSLSIVFLFLHCNRRLLPASILIFFLNKKTQIQCIFVLPRKSIPLLKLHTFEMNGDWQISNSD